MPESPKFKINDRVKVCFEGQLYVAEVTNHNVDNDPARYEIRLTGVETRSKEGTILGWLDLSGGLEYEVHETQLLWLDA